MELDRESIERRNFSSARRGYEPAEVDEHLRSVADAVEQFRADTQRQQQEQRTSLSTAAAERVRIILDAAETSAEEIRRAAEQEAEGIVADARRRGEEAQQRAEQEAADHVDNVERQTTLLFQRADRLQSELDDVLERLRTAAGGLIDGLRSEGGDLRSDLDALKQELAEARGSSSLSAGAAVVGADEPSGAIAEASPDFDEPADDFADRGEMAAVAEPTLDDEPVAAEPELEDEKLESPVEEPVGVADEQAIDAGPDEPEAEPGDAGAGEGDGAEGARLIALNMALNGTPREETAEYLERTFGLRNERLLDDVYARVQRS